MYAKKHKTAATAAAAVATKKKTTELAQTNVPICNMKIFSEQKKTHTHTQESAMKKNVSAQRKKMRSRKRSEKKRTHSNESDGKTQWPV